MAIERWDTEPKTFDNDEARKEIVFILGHDRAAEVWHPESGVRVRVHTYLQGYRLDVPTDSLDPRRGQRHRARAAIQDAGWRHYDGDIGPLGDTDDDAATWGYSVDVGDAEAAATSALYLLRTIADPPEDAPVRVEAVRR